MGSSLRAAQRSLPCVGCKLLPRQRAIPEGMVGPTLKQISVAFGLTEFPFHSTLAILQKQPLAVNKGARNRKEPMLLQAVGVQI